MPDEARGDDPVFVIGVAATLVSSHPQTLRMYERTGLVVPGRTRGNARLYSQRDLERIRRIQAYTAMGVNLAGIEIIFRLLDRIEQLESAAGAAGTASESSERSSAAREAALTAELRRRLRREEHEA
jgi:MerR family transcriptional regulator/heat shock protein HspR